MHPIICTIGPFTFYSYGLMVVLGFLTAVFLARRAAPKYGIDPQILSNFCFLLLILGIIGARMLYVALHFSLFKDNPLEIILLNRGGLSWFGALVAAFLGGIWYLKRKAMSCLRMLDFFSPYLALAQAIGRIGCLLNGCCFGYASDSGLYFSVHNMRLVPVQIYSSLFLILIFFFLRFLQERPYKAGSIFSLYLLLYSIKRFFIEFFRAEQRLFLLGLSVFQWISTGIFLIALIALVVIKRRK